MHGSYQIRIELYRIHGQFRIANILATDFHASAPAVAVQNKSGVIMVERIPLCWSTMIK